MFLVLVVHVLVSVGQDVEFIRNMWVTVSIWREISVVINSWKHGHETVGGTKMLTQSSGYRDGRSFVGTVIGRAALEQYLRGAPKGTKVEAWEGRIFTCSRPTSWDVSVAEGCKVTVSAVYLPKEETWTSCGWASLQDFIWLVTVASHTFFGVLDLSRCSEEFAGSACSCTLF